MALTAAGVEVGFKRILTATDFSAASPRAHHSTLYLTHVVAAIGFTLAGGEAVAMAEQIAYQDLPRQSMGSAQTRCGKGTC